MTPVLETGVGPRFLIGPRFLKLGRTPFFDRTPVLETGVGPRFLIGPRFWKLGSEEILVARDGSHATSCVRALQVARDKGSLPPARVHADRGNLRASPARRARRGTALAPAPAPTDFERGRRRSGT